MKNLKITSILIVVIIAVAWLLFMVFLMVRGCETYKPTEQIKQIHGLTKAQSYELFEDAYNAGYRKGRHYAKINKLTPFEIDVEADSALVMGKYWLNDSTPK